MACLDVTELLRGLFPAHYSLEGAHMLKSITLCSSIHVRGVYTSDNEYDYVTLPSDMRYKFAFDTATKWPEHFDWFSVPAGEPLPVSKQGFDGAALRARGQQKEEERAKMSQEINQLLNRKPAQALDVEEDLTAGMARR